MQVAEFLRRLENAPLVAFGIPAVVPNSPHNLNAAFMHAVGGDDRIALHNVCVFYDFCSMPQRPRSDAEEAVFRRAMNLLTILPHVAVTLVLREAEDDYMERGWCVAEYLSATAEGLAICGEDVADRHPDAGLSEEQFKELFHAGKLRWALGTTLVPFSAAIHSHVISF